MGKDTKEKDKDFAIPSKDTPVPKKGRTMTPAMYEQLSSARVKANEIRKKLAEGGAEAKIKHLQEKMDKVKLKGQNAQEPKEELRGDPLNPAETEEEIRGNPLNPTVLLKDTLKSEGLRERSSIMRNPAETEEETEEIVIKKSKPKPKKKKKPIIIVEDNSSSSEDENNVIYIKRGKREKKKTEPEEQREKPSAPAEKQNLRTETYSRNFNPFHNPFYNGFY